MERTILLVDDEENITSALMRLLRRDGYRILKANSGREGLELLRKNSGVGVIISDQRMPEMNGSEVLSQVKELYPDTVRIILSGYTELNSVTDAINCGAIYKFLTKPWEDDLLRANIDEAFRIYEMKWEIVRLSVDLMTANQSLSHINQELEQRVEARTSAFLQNLGILQVSQEILEHLPVAVIGIGDDGLIAIANKKANQLFGDGEALLGEFAEGLIPDELRAVNLSSNERQLAQDMKKSYVLPDGRTIYYWRFAMGLHSQAKGVVLVIECD